MVISPLLLLKINIYIIFVIILFRFDRHNQKNITPFQLPLLHRQQTNHVIGKTRLIVFTQASLSHGLYDNSRQSVLIKYNSTFFYAISSRSGKQFKMTMLPY